VVGEWQAGLKGRLAGRRWRVTARGGGGCQEKDGGGGARQRGPRKKKLTGRVVGATLPSILTSIQATRLSSQVLPREGEHIRSCTDPIVSLLLDRLLKSTLLID
jgi:hypothetical protein